MSKIEDIPCFPIPSLPLYTCLQEGKIGKHPLLLIDILVPIQETFLPTANGRAAMRAKALTVASLAMMAVMYSIFLLISSGTAQQLKSPDPKSMEARLRVLEDREEIRQLLIDYGRTLDQRDFKAFAGLFAENAEYIAGGAANTTKGPAAIAKLLQDIFQKNPTGVRSPNFHLFANETIQVDGDEAVAVSKGLFVVPSQSNGPEIVMMATYHDVLVRNQGKWKFRRRIVETDIPAPSLK